MTTSSDITLFSVPQTVSEPETVTTAQKFDAVLIEIADAVASLTPSDVPSNATWVNATDALIGFWNDVATHDRMVIRELARAVGGVMSDQPRAIDVSKNSANAIVDLSTSSDLAGFLDWPERKAQCETTAKLLSDIINLRDRGVLPAMAV
jgi:hypothetical protein